MKQFLQGSTHRLSVIYKRSFLSLPILLSLFLGLHTTTLYAQSYTWAKSMGSTSDDIGYAIAVDGSGNVYTTGYFQGTVDFNPSAGTANLTSAGNQDIFVCKFDASGNYVWAKKMGSLSIDIGYAIAVDGSGNVYTTGYFQGTVDFDPSAGTANLTAAGGTDIFVCKFDASGNYVWAKNMGSSSNDFGNGIAVDGSGNVYTAGSFQATADFDPNAGTANLTSAGGSDIFVCKFDASGNYVWAKKMGSSSTDIGYGIAVDGSGNVYTAGYFSGTADFNPSAATANLTSAGGFDIFVCKLDASGNYVWAKSMGSTSNDTGWSIAIDGSGNVYTTGDFQGTADFDPSAATVNLTSAGIQDMFVCKLDGSGNYVWAKRIGSTSSEGGYGIAVDASGSVYMTGGFQGTVDFDPSAATANLISTGNTDIFVCQFDASGNYVWAKNMGSTSTDEGLGIAVGSSANVYTTGYFQGTADFDPGAGTVNLTSAGIQDIFISKLSATVLDVELLAFLGKNTERGNLLTWQTANESNNKGFQVERRQVMGDSWETLGFITAHNKASNYQFLDDQTAMRFQTSTTLTYYRLRQIDNDGTETLSKVVSVINTSKSTGKIKVFPTLTEGVLTIVGSDQSMVNSVAVFNAVGQLVLSQVNTTRLDLSAQPTGIYFVQVKGSGEIVTEKVFKR